MRAGDRDLAAALRDAQSLVTVRTFEVAMRFPILKAQHSIMQAARDRPPLLEEFLILGVARLNVAREHAEVAQDKQRENEHAHPVPLHHPFDHHENDREQQQRVVQLIAAVSACHKSAQKIHVILPFARRDQR